MREPKHIPGREGEIIRSLESEQDPDAVRALLREKIDLDRARLRVWDHLQRLDAWDGAHGSVEMRLDYLTEAVDGLLVAIGWARIVTAAFSGHAAIQ